MASAGPEPRGRIIDTDEHAVATTAVGLEVGAGDENVARRRGGGGDEHAVATTAVSLEVGAGDENVARRRGGGGGDGGADRRIRAAGQIGNEIVGDGAAPPRVEAVGGVTDDGVEVAGEGEGRIDRRQRLTGTIERPQAIQVAALVGDRNEGGHLAAPALVPPSANHVPPDDES